MPDWDQIFTEKGYVFTDPHPEMERISSMVRKGARILDLGCGSGRHVVYLARMGFETHGFDVSPQALSMTQEWLKEESLSADLVEHSMEKPFPYPDDFFDAVISIQVIHHNLTRDILKTVVEIERVLKPNGLLFVTFPILYPGPMEEEHDWKLVEVEEGTYMPQRGWERGVPHHYFTLEEIPRVFRAFDIEDIFSDETDHRCVLARLRTG